MLKELFSMFEGAFNALVKDPAANLPKFKQDPGFQYTSVKVDCVIPAEPVKTDTKSPTIKDIETAKRKLKAFAPVISTHARDRFIERDISRKNLHPQRLIDRIQYGTIFAFSNSDDTVYIRLQDPSQDLFAVWVPSSRIIATFLTEGMVKGKFDRGEIALVPGVKFTDNIQASPKSTPSRHDNVKVEATKYPDVDKTKVAVWYTYTNGQVACKNIGKDGVNRWLAERKNNPEFRLLNVFDLDNFDHAHRHVTATVELEKIHKTFKDSYTVLEAYLKG